MSGAFALIPIPLVYLDRVQSRFNRKFRNYCLVPVLAHLKLLEEDLILFIFFTAPIHRLLVARDFFRLLSRRFLRNPFFIVTLAANLDKVELVAAALELQGLALVPLVEMIHQGIDALIEVLGYDVVGDKETVDFYRFTDFSILAWCCWFFLIRFGLFF